MADIERIAGMIRALMDRAQRIYPKSFPLTHFAVYPDGACGFSVYALGRGVKDISASARSPDEAYALACAELDERDPELIGRTFWIVTA